MAHPSASVTLSDLTFAWPDGSPVLDGLDAVFGSGRTGLVGLNGCGKSTLLKLIAGRLQPARGSVTAHGTVGYLPQDLTLDPGVRVDAILGISDIRRALARIESGAGTDDDFEVRNQLHMPVNRPVILHLESVDVIHSFFVPVFRLKQDIVPGLPNNATWFEATEVGEYEGACAELCGTGHTTMDARVSVKTQQDYDRWVAEKVRSCQPRR